MTYFSFLDEPTPSAEDRGKTITIVVADDHALVRRGLMALLEQEEGFLVVGEATDGAEAVEAVERVEPDILIVDLMMPTMNGIEVIRSLREREIKTQAILLSIQDDESYVKAALRSGARGYVLKEGASDMLAQAIRAVHAGHWYLCPPLLERTIHAYLKAVDAVRPNQEDAKLLTDRESEVLRLAAEGHSATSVARLLAISRRTVETHRANAMRKLGLHSQTELVRYAMRQGILSPEE